MSRISEKLYTQNTGCMGECPTHTTAATVPMDVLCVCVCVRKCQEGRQLSDKVKRKKNTEVDQIQPKPQKLHTYVCDYASTRTMQSIE